jgi:hypothetical protein
MFIWGKHRPTAFYLKWLKLLPKLFVFKTSAQRKKIALKLKKIAQITKKS